MVPSEADYKRQIRAADEATYQASQQALLAQAQQTNLQTRLNAVTGTLNEVVDLAAEAYADDPTTLPTGLRDKLYDLDPDRFA